MTEIEQVAQQIAELRRKLKQSREKVQSILFDIEVKLNRMQELEAEQDNDGRGSDE